MKRFENYAITYALTEKRLKERIRQWTIKLLKSLLSNTVTVDFNNRWFSFIYKIFLPSSPLLMQFPPFCFSSYHHSLIPYTITKLS